MCSATNNNSNNISSYGISNINNNDSPTDADAETIPFLDRSAQIIPYSYDDLLKDTIVQQNHVELFLEQIVASNDVTFL